MKVLLLAGEESGLLYAEQIARGLRAHDNSAEIRGYGDYGFETADLAVMGFWAVLKRLFYFLRVKRTMERAIVEWRPDVVCTVDYPGLNLKLAACAKAHGIRAVHVVCPQVWAWKKGRVPKVEASLDRLCCFFPFEPSLFSPGFAEFVGHPLADAFVSEGRAAPREIGAQDEKVLALLPGSRMGEIDSHLPTLLQAVQVLSREIPKLKVVVPAANEKAYAKISALVQAVGRTDGRPAAVSVRLGGAREVLRQADAAAVASGTATLEAALAGCPTVLVYKVGRLLAAFARWVIRDIRHIGLANIIAEKAGVPCPMPELLQERFTSENVLAALRPWLTDAAAREVAVLRLATALRGLSTKGNAIERIVCILLER